MTGLFRQTTVAEKSKFDIRITDEFDIELFWKQHGSKIVYAALGLLAVAIAAYVWQQRAAERAEQLSSTLASATDPQRLEQIIRENPGKQPAAQAMLRLADLQFQQGRYADAAGTYKRFADEFSQHPLKQTALLGEATAQEALGNLDAAKSLYNELLKAHPQGYAANAAKMGLARCAEAQGQFKEARQLYEELMAAGQSAGWQQQAYTRWVVLGREQPAEVATETPAPVESPVGPAPDASPEQPAVPTDD
jgi:hypothetical protein